MYPDVVDVATVTGRGGPTGAEPTGEQVLHVLQLQALGLWEATLDEEETQHHQARVHEERPWEGDSHSHFIHFLGSGCQYYTKINANRLCHVSCDV